MCWKAACGGVATAFASPPSRSMPRRGLTAGPSTMTARSRTSSPSRTRLRARSWQSSPRISGRLKTERTRSKPPNSWQAYDYYLQASDVATSFTSTLNVEHIYEARRLLQQSLAIDAMYARSYAVLANTYTLAWAYHASGNDFLNPSVLDEAHQFARKAVRLDNSLPQAHACLGFVLLLEHQHEASIAAFEKAIALNPNYVDWRFGFALVYAGDLRWAINVIEAHVRLDPFYPPMAAATQGFAHYKLKQYSRAVPHLRDCVSRAPRLRSGHLYLAATYAQLGQFEEARAEAGEILRLQPDYTITGASKRLNPFKSAKDDKHFFDGLRKAGLPEA
jgi:adenylate cyclase